jgi:hypothetical protein
MGVKEYYLRVAGFMSSTVTVAEDRDHQSLIVGVEGHSADPMLFFQTLRSSALSSFVPLYRHRKTIVFPSFVLGLISVIIGLVLGDIISIMILVACLPMLIAFLVHWKCLTFYGETYPVSYRIGFAVCFALTFSFSLGTMLSDEVKLRNARYGNTNSRGAGLVIGLFSLLGLASLMIYFMHDKKVGCCFDDWSSRRLRYFLVFCLFVWFWILWILVTFPFDPKQTQYLVMFGSDYIRQPTHTIEPPNKIKTQIKTSQRSKMSKSDTHLIFLASLPAALSLTTETCTLQRTCAQ